MRYGYAIRIGGDPEISGALKNGIEKGTSSAPATRGHLHPRGKALDSEAVRRVDMMRHTPEEWARMTKDAGVIYGGRRFMPRWAEKLLVGYAMLCYGIAQAFKAQDKVLERRD